MSGCPIGRVPLETPAVPILDWCHLQNTLTPYSTYKRLTKISKLSISISIAQLLLINKFDEKERLNFFHYCSNRQIART